MFSLTRLEVAVIVAVHNRRDSTVAALTRFMNLVTDPDLQHWNAEIYLTDDGSTDGTSEAVAELGFPITVVQGPGSWFWARSMAEAWKAIPAEPDLVLWLNDDVNLTVDALRLLDQWHRVYPNAVLVGQIADIDSGRWAAGGRVRVGGSPLRHSPAIATSTPVEVEMLHGNVVLVPRKVVDTVGRIDGGFSHGAADFDYGLRAVASGLQVLALPGFLGTTKVNPMVRASSIREALRLYERPLGFPFADRKRLLRRHGGILWPVQLALPYLALLVGYRPYSRLPNADSSSARQADQTPRTKEGQSNEPE